MAIGMSRRSAHFDEDWDRGVALKRNLFRLFLSSGICLFFYQYIIRIYHMRVVIYRVSDIYYDIKKERRYTSLKAGVQGFEPQLADPESAVLPLNDTPKCCVAYINLTLANCQAGFGACND